MLTVRNLEVAYGRYQVLWGIGRHECLGQVGLDIIAMSDPHLIQVETINKDTLGHNRAQIALGNQPHERDGVHHLLKAGRFRRGTDNGVVIGPVGCRRKSHSEGTIIGKRTHTGEDAAVGVLGEGMVRFVDNDQAKGPRDAL